MPIKQTQTIYLYCQLYFFSFERKNRYSIEKIEKKKLAQKFNQKIFIQLRSFKYEFTTAKALRAMNEHRHTNNRHCGKENAAMLKWTAPLANQLRWRQRPPRLLTLSSSRNDNIFQQPFQVSINLNFRSQLSYRCPITKSYM